MALWNKLTQAFAGNTNDVNQTFVIADRRGNPLSGNYLVDVAKGKIPGHSVVFISGRADSIAAPSTIWNVGGMYPWSAWNSGAQTLYLVSTSASDTHTVVINGLDSNYNLSTEVITLNGLTPVATTKQFIRFNSAYYVNAGSMNAGVIDIKTVSSSGTIVGRINTNIGQSSSSTYTVPAGYTAFSVWGDFSVNKNEGAELNSRWRFFNSGFITVYATEVYQSTYQTNVPIPGAIPEKTDIDNIVRFVTTANGTRVYSNQQLLLVDNNYL